MSRLDRETGSDIDITSDPPPTILTKTLPATIGDWALRGAVVVGALTASEGRALTLRMFADGEQVFESSVVFTSGATAALRTKRISYSGAGVEAGAEITLTLESDNANDTAITVDARLNADVEDAPHTWFVDVDYGHDTEHDGRSALSPFATVGAAITAAASGDVIHVAAGTYAEQVDLATASKSLTLQGKGIGQTIISQSVQEHTLVLFDHCNVRDLSAISTHAEGIGILAYMKTYPRLERVYAEGPKDGFYSLLCDHIVVDDCVFQSGWDGLVLQESTALVRNSRAVAVADFTDLPAHAVCVSGGSAILDNCIFTALRDTASDQDTFAVMNAGAHTLLTNCVVAASATNADNTGKVVGIEFAGTTAVILIRGCNVKTANQGSGDTYDLQQRIGGSLQVAETGYDSSKTFGTITQVSPGAAILADTGALDSRLTGAWAARLDADISSRATPADVTTAHTATDAKVDGLNDLSAAQVKTQADGALVDYDPPTKTEMDAAHALLATPADVHTTVTPAYARQPSKRVGGIIHLPEDSDETLAWRLTDADGKDVDLTGYTGLDLEVYAASGDLLFERTLANGGLVIDSLEHGRVTVTFTPDNLATAGTCKYEFWGVQEGRPPTYLTGGTMIIGPTFGPTP